MFYLLFNNHYNADMSKISINDDQWKKIEPMIRESTGRPAELDYRNIVNGILYREKTGISWRDLPTIYGNNWTSVHHHFQKWSQDGKWAKIMAIVNG